MYALLVRWLGNQTEYGLWIYIATWITFLIQLPIVAWGAFKSWLEFAKNGGTINTMDK